MTFYNTTQQTGEELKTSWIDTAKQDEIILLLFARNQDMTFTPFDIQNILQTVVGPQVNTVDSQNYNSLTTSTRISLAGATLTEYQIAYATESGGVVGAFTTYPAIFTVIAGSKQYFEVPFDETPYQPVISGGVGICFIRPLSLLFPSFPAEEKE